MANINLPVWTFIPLLWDTLDYINDQYDIWWQCKNQKRIIMSSFWKKNQLYHLTLTHTSVFLDIFLEAMATFYLLILLVLWKVAVKEWQSIQISTIFFSVCMCFKRTFKDIYRISSYNCRGNYSFLNSSSEETIQVFISLM